jgi:3-methyl-2-oxobutanoate hydroxymethyltransferase
MADKVTLSALQAMKGERRKIVGVVAWDTPTARILDGAGVDIVSVGDSVGMTLWGREREGDVTLDELVLLCGAVRRGVDRALVSCDLPAGVAGVDAARRLLEAGAGVVKVDGANDAAELARAGVPVFAQLDGSAAPVEELVEEARGLEDAGAALLDFRHSGREAGAKVVESVSIPVLGGLGGGPWLDGRMRVIHRLVDVGAAVHEAVAEYAGDVRAGRPVKGD